MSAPASPFERYALDDVAELIREYPLAWLCPRQGPADAATLLPLLPDLDAAGRLIGLVGHMSRRNPLVAALEAEADALILFTGPQGYVSPACVSDPAWAPTWNYAQARIEARIRFQPEATAAAVDRLVGAMDHEDQTGWTADNVGARHGDMMQRIIAFTADVQAVHGRFKLGQDEAPETLAEILARHPDAAMVRWMRRMNRARL